MWIVKRGVIQERWGEGPSPHDSRRCSIPPEEELLLHRFLAAGIIESKSPSICTLAFTGIPWNLLTPDAISTQPSKNFPPPHWFPRAFVRSNLPSSFDSIPPFQLKNLAKSMAFKFPCLHQVPALTHSLVCNPSTKAELLMRFITSLGSLQRLQWSALRVSRLGLFGAQFKYGNWVGGRLE